MSFLATAVSPCQQWKNTHLRIFLSADYKIKKGITNPQPVPSVRSERLLAAQKANLEHEKTHIHTRGRKTQNIASGQSSHFRPGHSWFYAWLKMGLGALENAVMLIKSW